MMYHPLGMYVTFETRRRERMVSALVGVAIGLGIAAVAYLTGAAS